MVGLDNEMWLLATISAVAMKHYRAKTLGALPAVASTGLCNRSRVTTRIHSARNYIMRSSTMWRSHASRDTTLEESPEAYLLVCYDQWWVNCVVGAIANCTHSSHWKEAIAVSSVHREHVRKWGRQWWSANDARTFKRSIFSESHTTKTLKTP